MNPIIHATALCFIAFGTAAPLVPNDSPWACAYAELRDGKISGQALPVIPYPGGKGYVLTLDYRITINGEELVIPRGFLFDGASVPDWIPKWVIGSHYDPEFMLPALVHDWLYWSRQWPKDKADAILRDLLRANGVGFLRANAMYRAVQVAGGPAWKNGPVVTADSLWIIEGDDIVPHPNLLRADRKEVA